MRQRLRWRMAVGVLLAVTAAQAQFGLDAPKVLHPELAFSPAPAWPGQEITVSVLAKLDEGWHAYTNQPPEELGLIPTEVTLEAPEGWEVGEVAYPAGDPLVTPLADEPVPVYHDQVVFQTSLSIPTDIEPGEYPLRVQVRYQACDDATCLPPVTAEAEGVLAVAPEGTPQTETIIEAGDEERTPEETPAAIAPAPQAVPEEAAQASTLELLKAGDVKGLFTRLGPIFTYGAIFLLGLLLNLTPCVWPVIPITVSYFSNQSSGDSRRAFGLAALYVLGIAVTYSTLGVIASLSGGLFGQALQKPIVTLFIVQVLVALALSSFGLFELRLPVAVTGGGRRGAALESLLMGLMVGLVAAPCVGPVIISLLIWVAEKQSAVLGFTAFFTLALGMGLPYLILGTATGSARALPKSGDWMLWIKKLFGFVILAVALYFLEPLLAAGVARFLYVELALIAALVLAVLDRSGANLPRFRFVKWGVGLLSLAIAIWLALPRPAPAGEIAWEPFTEARLAQAQQEGTPVVVDFRADWCIPCRRMERTIFVDEKVIQASEGFVMLKADVTRSEDPEVVELQKEFEVRGVPTLLFFDSQGNEVERVTKVGNTDDFLKYMSKAR